MKPKRNLVKRDYAIIAHALCLCPIAELGDRVSSQNNYKLEKTLYALALRFASNDLNLIHDVKYAFEYRYRSYDTDIIPKKK